MTRKHLPLFVFFLFNTAILSACSTGTRLGETSPRQESEQVFFIVENYNWSDGNVYLVKEGGERRRLGMVVSMTQEKFSLRYSRVGTGRLYFCVHFIGGVDFCYPPEGFSVSPNDEVDFRIANHLVFSSIFIR